MHAFRLQAKIWTFFLPSVLTPMMLWDFNFSRFYSMFSPDSPVLLTPTGWCLFSKDAREKGRDLGTGKSYLVCFKIALYFHPSHLKLSLSQYHRFTVAHTLSRQRTNSANLCGINSFCLDRCKLRQLLC